MGMDSEVQRNRAKQLQDQLKDDLDKQIVDYRLKDARERQQDAEYFDQYIAPHGNWMDQENEKRQRAKEKALKIQKDRDVQIQADRARKAEAQRIAKQEADDLTAKVRRDEETDKQETEKRRLM